MNKEFDLEYQYQLYLQRVNLSESRMHPITRKELRQAFMAACGQMLILLRDELSKLEEDDGLKVFDDMMNQVTNYFLKANERQN